MRKIVKKYTNGEITVVWQPDLCVHATTCFTELPKVFVPYERPWIKLDKGVTEEIIKTVCNCPTDALTYFWNKDMKEEQKTENTEEKSTEIKILKNGPFLVKGDFNTKLRSNIEYNIIFAKKNYEQSHKSKKTFKQC